MVAKAAVRRVQYKVANMLTPVTGCFWHQDEYGGSCTRSSWFYNVSWFWKRKAKIDFTHAFNTFHRDVILKTVRRDLPELFSLLKLATATRLTSFLVNIG